jgi:phospholipase/lecithinase/hemolysin
VLSAFEDDAAAHGLLADVCRFHCAADRPDWRATMVSRIRVFVPVLAVVTVLILNGTTHAEGPYSEIIVFGDSVSDTGNVFLFTEGAAVGPPYFEGRFSNGPVWVDVLAANLGLPAPAPSLIGGANYAWGGAETGPGLSTHGTFNVGMQIEQFLEDRGGFTGDELIIVEAGSNDLIFRDPPAKSADIVRNLSEHIAVLAAAGGETFLVSNILASGATGKANRLLAKELEKLEQKLGVTIVPFDMVGVVNAMRHYPEQFGLTNVTDPACPGCGIGIPEPDAADTLVSSPDEYLWWDLVHMTWVAHQAIGEAATEVLAVALQP